MSLSTEIIFGIMFVASYLITPAMMIWGWTRWLPRPRLRTLPSILSLIGFILATTSALLAVSSLVYAQMIGGFPFYDPLLMKIYRWGGLISLAGVLFGFSGIWRSSSVRWHAPACAVGMLLFWALAAEGE
jgi:hypothetical protein